MTALQCGNFLDILDQQPSQKQDRVCNRGMWVCACVGMEHDFSVYLWPCRLDFSHACTATCALYTHRICLYRYIVSLKVCLDLTKKKRDVLHATHAELDVLGGPVKLLHATTIEPVFNAH